MPTLSRGRPPVRGPTPTWIRWLPAAAILVLMLPYSLVHWHDPAFWDV